MIVFLRMKGRLSPITYALREIADIFGRMGFEVRGGPELEDEWYNFTALNIPPDHPARDMQDTFWIKSGVVRGEGRGVSSNLKPQTSNLVLRTHTTSVTIRELEKMAKEGRTSMRAFNPGKVFRNEATDMTHEAQFYQIDGFAAGPTGEVTLSHLKGTFLRLYREYLGPSAKVRFRPSYFSFVEPGVEVDVWFEPQGKEGRWLEMSGAGMIHPKVLQNAGLDPAHVQGFAFGGGLERLIMIKYGIPDVRLFHSGDLRLNYGFEIV